MITVVIKKENIISSEIIIKDKKDINHLKNSFRVKEKDEVRAVDGEKEYICEVIEINGKEIRMNILSSNFFQKSSVEIVAGISIIKNDKMELVIQKLTEIGIDKIIPLETKRTIVKLKEKKDKWNIISREAQKQCQRINFLNIDEIKKLKEIISKEYDLIVIPYESEENHTFKDFLKNQNENIKKILYIIGPEGGFSNEEIEYLKSLSNSYVVTLGKNILRAETAAIIVGGILVNEFK